MRQMSIRWCYEPLFTAFRAAYPAFCLRYRVLLLQEIKRGFHEADHPPPFGTEINNEWIFTSCLPYAFMERTDTTLFYFISLILLNPHAHPL